MTSPGAPPEKPHAPEVIELAREPRWAGGRFRLRRRPASPRATLPLWARVGLRSKWRIELALTLTALFSAAVACALLAAAVFLPGPARWR